MADGKLHTPTQPVWTPRFPVLDDALEPPSGIFVDGAWRSFAAVFTYRDASARVLFHIFRIDMPDGGKQIRPLTYCRNQEGHCEWRNQAAPLPRPLYGLDRLAARPDATVLVCEGEKAADAAADLFPEFVAVTSPNGAQAAAKADWSQLAGRALLIWPDHDSEGQHYAKEVARLAVTAGAVTIGIVEVPENFPPKWDVADTLPEGVTPEALKILLEAASQHDRSLEFVDPEASLPPGFQYRADGLYAEVERAADGDDEGPPRYELVCSPIHILARTRDAHGHGWGLLVRVIDFDGQPHEIAFPMEMLSGDGAPLRALLMHHGLVLQHGVKARNRLAAFFARAVPKARVLCVSQIGWHGSRYVLPDRAFGIGGENLRLQTEAPIEHAFHTAGSLEGWQKEVATPATGNSRIVFAIACAFAAPLLPFVSAEGGGFHLRGASSLGKTTALKAAASVCGGGAGKPYIRSFRATANGLEGVAQAHNHALLGLDELGQIDGRELGQVVYMLANGEGKSRARKDGAARPLPRWQLLFLSTGEQSLKDKMGEAGKPTHAGQETRFVEIPADAGRGLGLFERLNGFDSAAALANHFKSATERHCGHPLRAFLVKVASNLDGLADRLRAAVDAFAEDACPDGADGQVRRVAERFGLVAAAGELAIEKGIVFWLAGEARAAARACFDAWLEERGGIEPAEERAAVAQVRAFLEAHGESRFAPWDGPQDRPVINRVGFRRAVGGKTEFLIFPEAYKNEICAGRNARFVTEVLKRKGVLETDSQGRSSVPERVPGMNKSIRLYVIRGEILEG
jgi:uncharacterized protein (DUF927 family)